MDAFTAGPPERFAVGFRVGLPEDGDSGFLEMFEGCGDLVYLGDPALVEIGAGGKKFFPFKVGELAVKTGGSWSRLVICRAGWVP